jgi:hypothetical protein
MPKTTKTAAPRKAHKRDFTQVLAPKTSAEKNAANRALATAGKAAPRRRRPAPEGGKTIGVSVVTADGLNDWLVGYCYKPKAGTRTGKVVIDRARFEALCKANGVWNGGVYDDMPNGRLRMVCGIRLRARLAAGEPFNVPE